MSRSKITSKGQTTVPKEVRKALGLEPGDRITWEINGKTVTVEPAKRHPFFDLEGTIKVGPGDVTEDIRKAREMRGRV